ncbi:amino acid adenylation domain-containing protein, partial [uncultured Chryseobacterium sp.]|uniref:non-ribosomal peptide synthetase n=1 Tax=uncultured Chryseobacterium sp. TaxID=259322 RepID=UPI00262BB858
MSEEEQHQLLVTFNQTATDYPRERSVVDLFEEQVSKTPHKPAVVFEQQTLSYQQLDLLSSQLAAYLHQQYQVQPGDSIAIMTDRSDSMIIAVLAVLKTGAAYVPIESDFPASRKEYIIRDAAIKTIITQTDYIFDFGFFTGSIVAMDVQADLIAATDPVLRYRPSASDLAYIMYTSGSTGTPKGVLIEHRSVVRLVKNTSYIDFRHSQTLLSTGAFAFDATTFEYWGMLLNGGCLVVCSKDVLLDHHKLAELLIEKQVDTMWFTAGWFNQLVDNHIELFLPLKTVLAGGDKLSVPHVNALLEKYPHLSIINGYGPTENTTFSITYRINQQLTSIPIGKPISNTQVYILDDHHALVPVGVAGEICLAGDGLARGYLNNPGLTAEKFVANPFVPGARMYKTGDLGRWRPDGNIEFLGRKDEQVKIRGYRIEPGEIESCLKTFAGITDAVVVVKNNKAAEKLLAAYLVATGQPDMMAIREHLASQLPSYMLPDHYVQLEAFPLNANGKVDKKQLPDPEGISLAGGVEYIPPRNKTEELLVNIWQDILGKERVGVNDNFFDIGGHSLRATRLVSQIHKTFEVKIDLRDLFITTVLEDQAALIDSAQKAAFVGITPAQALPDYPLSSAQRRLWVLSQLQES